MSYQCKDLAAPFTRSRRDTLDYLGILDTDPEPGFDDIVALAAQICATPISTISLIDEDRQWFKAQIGFSCRQTPLVRSVCADTLSHPGLLVIPDLQKDPRSCRNAAVTGEPHIRFYARVRLQVAGGEPFGTLCVIDHEPRPAGLSDDQAKALTALAGQVISQLELRKAIEDRDRGSAALRTSEARMRAVFETSYQFQGVIAADGTLLDANAPSLDSVQCRLEDVVGRKFWDTPWFAPTPGMREQIRADVATALGGARVRRELELLILQEKRIFDFTLRPVQGDGAAVAGLVYEAADLTERRRAEAQLRQAQKMELVGQLTGGIAHDFNNMLAIVVGFLGLARRKLASAGDAVLLEYLDNAAEGANRAIALTRRLLAFSRQQELAPSVVQVGRLVENLAELLRRTLTETIRVETRLGADLWTVNIDTGQLENALVNLAVNGRDAMPEGGLLEIAAENVARTVSFDAAQGEIVEGDFVVISVRDTGAGMAPDVCERAFDPFFTTKKVGRGSGLGLSQVLGFVQQSGGHVQLVSVPQDGTTVRLYLPRFGDPYAAPADEAAADAVPLGKSEDLILVVEDEDRVRDMTVESLTMLGYQVVSAATPTAALRELRGNPKVTLLFTDVVMPEMNGRQLAEAAVRDRPDLRVLYTTGCTRDADLHRALIEDGAALLSKPFTIEQLAAKMRQALGR